MEFSAPTPGQISPTDVAQFIRLEQCERYLRLRLHERSGHHAFMRDYGVAPQAIPPLLTRSGKRFEETIEREVQARFPTLMLGAKVGGGGRRDNDNLRVVERAKRLGPGNMLLIFQPRVEVAVGGWHLRGDLDILRLERAADGALHILIADMKSSTSAKVEHRLQVAFYHEMVAALFDLHAVPYRAITLGILYRGPTDNERPLTAEDAALRESQLAAAQATFGTRAGLLEVVSEAADYIAAVTDLVTGPESTAVRVGRAEFGDLAYHLTVKCDGCLYNEFCMKWSAERDDLSLLPHMSAQDKGALRRAGVTTARQTAGLKVLLPAENGIQGTALIPIPETTELVRRLSATWPVGPRLDELIHRAQRYRKWKGDPLEALSYIAGKGYGSLPFASPTHNPNLVRVYIDAQQDYLGDRLYMLGALVVGCENGEPVAERRRGIVHLVDGPPDAEREAELILGWTNQLLRAIVEVAAPDAEGAPRAPIHLIFFNRLEQRIVLEALGRHLETILGATPLYDFVTQLAAFDSPIVTFLDEEIREHKNYPMVCQSLQAVAAYLKFDWNSPQPYRTIFRVRLFDFWRALDDPSAVERDWYTGRARFTSMIPLEYAYAAWGELASPTAGHDDFAAYRTATADLLRGFQSRRLEAIEHITQTFTGNKQTEKRSFDLPSLDRFGDRAHTLAHALDEFVLIERHVSLAGWKAARLAPPERRVLSGDTLLAGYNETDQAPGIAIQNRLNREKQQKLEEARLAGVTLDKAQKKALTWSHEGLRISLRFAGDLECGLDEVLGLSTLKPGDSVVVCKRWDVDSRLPAAEQTPYTPTAKQMLYGTRAILKEITAERDDASRAIAARVELEMRPGHGGAWSRGFVFGSMDKPFEEDTLYSIDSDPNDWYGYWCAKVTEELCSGGQNTLYRRLTQLGVHLPPVIGATGVVALDGDEGDHTGRPYEDLPGNARPGVPADQPSSPVAWPDTAVAGQARFLAGLQAFQRAGLLPPFEPGKQEYIGGHGETPVLLVQGPPGTGKSYTTAFAVLARLQGAMAGGQTCRVFLTCKTHHATDVLLEKLVETLEELRALRTKAPRLFEECIDPRLLETPCFRVRPRGAVPAGVIALPRKEDLPPGTPKALRQIEAQPWCVVATTPGGAYGTVKEEWPKALLGHELCDILVLDEASQMNLPEAVMAALLLKPTGRLIVVGDPRQMPPIIKHDWSNEPRRTFKEYRAFESLFAAFLPLGTATIKFNESFRLHRDMAAFLCKEIYRKDGIAYFSQQHRTLAPGVYEDPFVAAVLSPEHPLVVVVHDEADSQHRNSFEQALATPLLEALAVGHGLGPEHGLGVVVPHRAQRAALQEAIPCLTVRDPQTQVISLSAVDTVERFQGGERDVIVVSATESDREYLRIAGDFLLDPRRLTVALSRAKHKMVLIASRSVFGKGYATATRYRCGVTYLGSRGRGPRSPGSDEGDRGRGKRGAGMLLNTRPALRYRIATVNNTLTEHWVYV